MASRIPFLKMAQSLSTALKSPFASTSTRRHSSTLSGSGSPFSELDLHLLDLQASLYKKVAGIRTSFVAPGNREIHDTKSIGSGVCVDPTLLITSACAVGRVATFRRSSGSTLRKAYIGSSAALFYGIEEPVRLVPAAVSFGLDLAVLKVVGGPPLPVIPTARYPPEKESVLMAISRDQEGRWGICVANVRAEVGERTIKAAAPWPLEDAAAWMEHDWMVFHRGPPPSNSVLFAAEKKVSGAISKLNGTPWFNMYGELVGVASWLMREDPAVFSVGYATPLCNILTVLQYAKTKGDRDRVVMDKWIKREVINTGGDEDVINL